MFKNLIDTTMQSVFSFFPNAEGGDQVQAVVANKFDLVEPTLIKINALFPLETLFQILELILAIELTLLLFSLVFRIIQLVRG